MTDPLAPDTTATPPPYEPNPHRLTTRAGLPIGKGHKMPEGACCTCWEQRHEHADWCPVHPVNAARRERESLGMFAPPESTGAK